MHRMNKECFNFDPVGIQRRWAEDNVGGAALRWSPDGPRNSAQGTVFHVAETDRRFPGGRQESHRERRGLAQCSCSFQPTGQLSSCPLVGMSEWALGRDACYISMWEFTTQSQETGERSVPPTVRHRKSLEGGKTVWWLSGKESTHNAGDTGSIPGSGISPGEEKGNPLQYTCLENTMDRGTWLQSMGLQKKSDTI